MANHRKITDPELVKKINLFRVSLMTKGYASATIKEYVKGASNYLLTGLPITKEAIEKYYNELKEDKTRKLNPVRKERVAALRYLDCQNGNEENLKGWMKYLSRRKDPEKICDEDCFNCIYPDCILD